VTASLIVIGFCGVYMEVDSDDSDVDSRCKYVQTMSSVCCKYLAYIARHRTKKKIAARIGMMWKCLISQPRGSSDGVLLPCIVR